MKYARFEDLPAWKAASDLAAGAYRLTRRRFFAQPGDLRDQLRRAALSVANNIAEGFERGSTAELLAFLYIARGSAGETRSMLRFALRLLDEADAEAGISDRKSEISDGKSEISNLKVVAGKRFASTPPRRAYPYAPEPIRPPRRRSRRPGRCGSGRRLEDRW